MRIHSWKTEISVAWILAVAAAGYLVGAASVIGWLFVVIVALTLPVLFRRFWHAPDESMSESIRDVLQ